MNIYIANNSKQSLGGGWSFIYNLKKALTGKINFVDDMQIADIYFIPSASMVDKDDVYRANALDKPIILRVDNAIRDSRNRGCGMSRMKRYAELASKVIYQSRWAREYLEDFLHKSGPVIYNGCDTDIFKKDGNSINSKERIYLYVRYNRDETKCWHEAWYEFYKINKQHNNSILWIVGNFSPELIQYNFDFFNGEKVKYWGVIEDKEMMATIYRSADYLIYPFYNDACSNTLIEARACGTKIMLTASGATGGSMEILNNDNIISFNLERMGKKYLKVFEEVACEESLYIN